jgi:hypothetical protein
MIMIAIGLITLAQMMLFLSGEAVAAGREPIARAKVKRCRRNATPQRMLMP